MLAPIGIGASTPSAYVYDSRSTERQYPPAASNDSENKISLRLNATETNDPAEYYAKSQVNAMVLEAQEGLTRSQTDVATLEVVSESDLEQIPTTSEKEEEISTTSEEETPSSASEQVTNAAAQNTVSNTAAAKENPKPQKTESEKQGGNEEQSSGQDALAFGVGSNMMAFRYEIAAAASVE